MVNGLDEFLQVLKDCYSLSACRLDKNLDLVWSNSVSPSLHKALLLSLEWSENLRQHMETETMPLVLGPRMDMLWTVAVIPADNSEGGSSGLMALGPVYNNHVTPEMKERSVAALTLSVSDKNVLLDFLTHVPYLLTTVLFQHTIMLHRYLSGHTINISDFVYRMPVQQEITEIKDRKEHIPFINEQTLFDMVRTGNLNFHSALSAAGAASPGIRADVGPIQQGKYSVVSFITLCARAAIEGGLSADIAYTLSDNYTEMVDKCRTFSELGAVSHTMYEDYILRVHRCRSASGVSRKIQACQDYIDIHIADDLTLEELAARSGYATYYFSRMFKRETGQTVSAYIRSVRLRRARQLLVSTHMSIQEISDYLRFCSRSYFALQFENETGLSPAAYRAKHQNG